MSGVETFWVSDIHPDEPDEYGESIMLEVVRASDYDALRAENARLWSENEAKAQGYRDVHEMLKASQRLNSIALGAICKHWEDVLSLRAALEQIIAQDDVALAEEGYREGFANVVRIARRALAKSVTHGEHSGERVNRDD